MSRTSRRDDFAGAGMNLPTGTLSGGISQQPEAARFGNQVSNAVNADFAVMNGSSRRNGTMYRQRFSLTAGAAYRLHAIDRDRLERYVILKGLVSTDMRLRPFERFGESAPVEGTVTYGTGAQTYLNYGGATASDIKLVTAGDTTLVINTKRPVAMLTSPSYSLTATWDDADTMVAQTPAVDTYHQARADGVDLAKGFYKYLGAGGNTFPTFSAKIWPYTDWDQLRGDWDSSGNDPKCFRMAFRRVTLSLTGVTAALVGGDEWTLTKTGGFTSYTLAAGDMIRVTGGTGVTFAAGESSGFLTVVSRDSNDQITVRDAATGPTYSVGASVALAATGDVVIDGVGREFEISINFSALIGSSINDMSDIADRIQQEFRALGGDDVLVGWDGSLNGNGAFRVTGPWAGNQTTVYPPLTPITNGTSAGDLTVDDRPFSKTASEYTIVAGTGPLASGSFPIASRWQKVYASDEENYKPDPTTMPHALRRLTFTGDGSTASTWILQAIDWNAREDGDDETNPALPLFTQGQPITAAAVYRSRLVLGSGSRVACSRIDDVYNFYRADATVVADDDAFGVLLSDAQVPTIFEMATYADQLLVMTDPGRMFVLGGERFTPSLATVTLGPFSPAIPHTPAVSNNFAYYLTTPGNTSGEQWQSAALHRLTYDALVDANSGENVSDHVPTMIDVSADRLVYIPSEDWLGVITRDARLHYVLRNATLNGREVLRAWSVYQFDASVRIVDAVALRNEVWYLTERVTRDANNVITASSGEYVFEVMRINRDATALAVFPSTTQLPLLMDRQTTLSGTFDGTYTNYTLPFTDSTITKVTTPDGVLRDLDRPSGTAARVLGNYAGTGILSRPFNWVLTLTRPFFRFSSGNPALSETVAASAMILRTRRSAGFDVQIQRGNDLIIRKYTPVGGFQAGEDSIRIAPVGTVDDLTISVTSNDYRPCNLQSVEFVAMGSRRPMPTS
jgi:hypothetical protein